MEISFTLNEVTVLLVASFAAGLLVMWPISDKTDE